MTYTRDDAEAPSVLTERALALRWQLSARTLQRWRANGSGPPFLPLGRRIRYRFADVLDYERRMLGSGRDNG